MHMDGREGMFFLGGIGVLFRVLLFIHCFFSFSFFILVGGMRRVMSLMRKRTCWCVGVGGAMMI